MPREPRILNRKSRRHQMQIARVKEKTAAKRGLNEKQQEILYAPENMTLSSSAGVSSTLEFFTQLRAAVDNPVPGTSILVDLVKTRTLDLAAALSLVAEFDRWQRLSYSILLPKTVANWHPAVRDELQLLGFFKLLKTKLPPGLRQPSDKAWIQFVSDKLTVGRAATLLRRRLDQELGTTTRYSAQIYIVLIEAMKNAFQHAYPDEKPTYSVDSRVGKRWWMAASIDRHRNHIEVAFLDLGITIPRSLPDSWMWPYLPQNARVGRDLDQIIEALRYGQSRLGQPHRGKGFANILRPVTFHRDNFVSILSGRGLCYIGSEQYAGIETEHRFSGTLIRWRLNLNSSL